MVNEFLKLTNQIETNKGKMTLFMLWRTALDSENWNMVVSSKWSDRMTEKSSLTYLVTKLKENLTSELLSRILRINVLKTSNPFVLEVIHKYPVINNTVHFENQTIKGVYIKEAHVICSTIKTNQLEVGDANINPRFNANLNPRFNANINPRFNANLNPRFNANINPRNAGFQGMFSYDTDLNRNGYFIKANENVILFYSSNNSFESIGVKTNTGYAIFNLDNDYVGFLVDANQIMLWYNTNNDWIGSVVK